MTAALVHQDGSISVCNHDMVACAVFHRASDSDLEVRKLKDDQLSTFHLDGFSLLSVSWVVMRVVWRSDDTCKNKSNK